MIKSISKLVIVLPLRVALVPTIFLFQFFILSANIWGSVKEYSTVCGLTFNKDWIVSTAFFIELIKRSWYLSKPFKLISLSTFTTSKYILKSLNPSGSNRLLYKLFVLLIGLYPFNKIGFSFSSSKPHLYNFGASRLTQLLIIYITKSIIYKNLIMKNCLN